MKKKLLALLLAVVLATGLLPGAAFAADAAEAELPDWYFLFAIFKNMDADCVDNYGVTTHVNYTMTQEEIDIAWDNARAFEEYMNSLGVMRAHVDVVEIDEPVTELEHTTSGSFLDARQAAPLLEDKVDLDRYDHVSSVISQSVVTGHWGMTYYAFDNGTGHGCVLFRDLKYARQYCTPSSAGYPASVFVHEYLHFLERMNTRWGAEFDLHTIRELLYSTTNDEWYTCYTDIILDRADGSAGRGTGVAPAVWQYPPHVLRTMSELTVPEGVSAVGVSAFMNLANLEKVILPGSVTDIGTWSFGNCTALTDVYIPAGVTSVGYAAFWNTGLTDVYYGGSEEQWNAISFGDFNSSLTGANVHYNCVGGDAGDNITWSHLDGVLTFSGDGSMRNYSYPDSGKAAPWYDFREQIHTVRLDAGVSSIGTYAFRDCSSLERIVIPDGITGIDTWTFGNCTALTGVSIPASVTSIGYAAFWNTGLTDVYYGGSEEQWNAISFGDFNSSLTNANIHFNRIAFSDVPANEWYADAVVWASSNGVTSGTGDGATFSPGAACSRAEIVTFLWRAYGEPKPVSTANPFTDVKPADWYYDAVLWAVENGITSGTGNGTTFSPNGPCTRKEAVTFQYRAADSPAVTGGSSFNDVSSREWYAGAVAWAVENDITSGTGDGTTFSPDWTCARSQIVTFLWRELGQPAQADVSA